MLGSFVVAHDEYDDDDDDDDVLPPKPQLLATGPTPSLARRMNQLNPNLRLQQQQQLQLPVLSPPPGPQHPFVAREMKEGSRWNSKKIPTSAGFLYHPPNNHSYVVCHKFWSIMHLAGAAAVTIAASRLNLSCSSIRDLQKSTTAKSIQVLARGGWFLPFSIPAEFM